MINQICRNPGLEFVAAPALAPAEVAVDENLMKQYEAELQRVRFPHYHLILDSLFIFC